MALSLQTLWAVGGTVSTALVVIAFSSASPLVYVLTLSAGTLILGSLAIKTRFPNKRND